MSPSRAAVLAISLSSVSPASAQQAPPIYTAPAPIAPLEPRSTTMMGAGIVMSALGGAMLHAAALYPVLHEDNCFGGCSNERSVSGGFALSGAALIVVGVPLLIVGTKHVRPPPTSTSREAALSPTFSTGSIALRGLSLSF